MLKHSQIATLLENSRRDSDMIGDGYAGLRHRDLKALIAILAGGGLRR
ncbi:hypothetical protein [Phormidium nigroviride]